MNQEIQVVDQNKKNRLMIGLISNLNLKNTQNKVLINLEEDHHL